MIRPIQETVLAVFDQVIRDFQLRVFSQSAEEVWLVSKEYVISLSVDMDGINMRYIDPDNFDTFDLSLYLVARRGGVAEMSVKEEDLSREKKIIRELEIDATLLSKKGADILRGEKKWMKDYGWPPLNLPDPRDRERVAKVLRT